MLIFPILVVTLILGTAWPCFFRRWKHWHFLLIGNNVLIAGLGVWVMIHFQLERRYSLYAEAEAVEASIRRIDSGSDPRMFGAELAALLQDPAFLEAPLRDRLRLWRDLALRGIPAEKIGEAR